MNADLLIGKHCIKFTHAIIGHDCEISYFSYTGTSTLLACESKTCKNNLIGGGSFATQIISVFGNIFIGSWPVIIEYIKNPGSYIGSSIRKIK